MVKSIVEFKGKHRGADIWIIASGASMDYVNPSFFEGKVVVGVNEVYKKFLCNYLVFKDGAKVGQKCINSGIPCVCSRYDCGNYTKSFNKFDGDYYLFNHLPNSRREIDLSPLDSEDMLVVSITTITSAIHFAYYLGAKNIIVCGHDLGLLDGKINFDNYYNKNKAATRESKYVNWFKEYEPQTIKLIAELRHRGVNVHSLNPFINFGLEGHKYER